MNKSIRVSVIAGLALALASTGALAQAKKSAPPPAPVIKSAPPPSSSGIGDGDKEIGFFGSLRHDDFSDSTTLGVSFGTFISDNLELRTNQTVSISNASGGSTFVSYTPTFTAEYQFRTGGSPVVPYIGGGGGLFLGGDSNIFFYALFLTPTAGVKYFLNERTSVEYALAYNYSLLASGCDSYTCTDVDIEILQNTLRINFYY